MKKKLFFLYFTAANVCLLLVGSELFGQAIYYLIKGYPISHFSSSRASVFEPHPYLVGRLRANTELHRDDRTIRTTSINTRWTGAPKDDDDLIRVALLGGSTTFGTRLADGDTWPALLQEILGDQYAVINYGVPGYSTAEAIIQMSLVVPSQEPHIVVFYEGINDIRNYHDPLIGEDYYSHGMQQYSNFGLFHPQTRMSLSRKAAQFSSICLLAVRIHDALRRKFTAEGGGVLHETSDPFVDAIYSRNLRTLKTLADAMGARAIFIPQVLNNEKLKGAAGGYVWTPTIKNSAMPALMEHFNSAMVQAFERTDPPVEIMESVLEGLWKQSDFVDYWHFSRSGGMKLATMVAERIKAPAPGGVDRLQGNSN